MTMPKRLLAILLLSLLPLSAFASHKETRHAHYLHRKGPQALRDLLHAELSDAKAKHEPVVLMFTADWCSPCKAIKEYAEASGVVRKVLEHGRLVYIDVDEWRGPAQALFQGIDVSKLPTLVSVDFDGRAQKNCFGTDLGLLSEDAVATNLQRMLNGQLPDKPFYVDKPDTEKQLILQQAQAQGLKLKGVPTLEVAATGTGNARKVKLSIHNNDGPRRWFLLPANVGAAMPAESVKVPAWRSVRWTEHVRADYLQFDGQPAFYAIPVAGYGGVELDAWPLPGTPKNGELVVYELDRLSIDGQDQSFQQKLPYELKIEHPEQSSPGRTGGAAKVEFRVHAKHVVKMR
jgi:thiol-disulfide isomerase/thioredoxin